MVAVALDDYWEEHGQFTASASTTKRNITTLKHHLKLEYVSALTPARMKKYERERETTNAAINRELGILTAALNHEFMEGRLNSVPKIKKLLPHKPRQGYLNDKQLDRLMDCCASEHVKAFIMIARHTGARPGAIESLKWFQVDFKKRVIYFTRDGKKATKKRKVDSYMTPSLYTYMKKLHAAKHTEYVLEFTPSGMDKAIPAGCTKLAFKRAAMRAKLPQASRYTLRHSVGTKLKQMGVSMKHGGEVLGNSAETFEKHYVKAVEADRKNTTMLLDESAQLVRKSQRGKK